MAWRLAIMVWSAKQNMYEHSLRVPFIVAGPGVKADQRVNSAIHLQDVMATSLELAGVAKARYLRVSQPGTDGQGTHATISLAICLRRVP